MDIVTLDFETFYGTGYTLSSMTTEAYIRDPKFEVIGVGFSRNGAPAKWFSGTKSDIQFLLDSLILHEAAVLCHNTVFDGAILSWHFGIKPRLWLDTLSMARPLHNVQVGNSLAALVDYYNLGSKGDEVIRAFNKRRADFTPEALALYGEYCCKDVDLTYKLFQKLKTQIPVPEVRLIDQIIRMFTEPVIELDDQILHDHLEAERQRKAGLLAKIGGEKARKAIMSNVKFAQLLTARGVMPPMKTSLTTGQPTYAFAKTDRGMLALLEHEDPVVATLAEVRLGVKSSIEETRTQSMLNIHQRGGTLPVMLNYYGAHTGRLSGGDRMNLQNLPRTSPLRRALKAPKGKVFVACDSSQIEARVVAYLAGQKDLLTAFREQRDIYSEFASVVYGRHIDRKNNPDDKGPGFVGKTCILGLGYGMGDFKFKRTLEVGNGYKPIFIPPDEAARIVRLYRDTYPRIPNFWRRCDRALTAMVEGKKGELHPLLTYDGPTITLPNGLKIQYPALCAGRSASAISTGYRYIDKQRVFKEYLKRKLLDENLETLDWTDIYGGKVTENVVQAIARLVVTEQMAIVGERYPVVLQVHDELVICVNEGEADEAKRFIVDVMSTPPKWAPSLPVACEAGVAERYGDT